MQLETKDGITSGSDYMISLWKDEQGKVYGLDHGTMKWNTLMLGNAGNGKSVNALNQIYADILAGEFTVVIDPFGNRIDEIKNYLDESMNLNVLSYSVAAVSDQENQKNREGFTKELSASDGQNLVLINLNYKAIGAKQAGDLGDQIISYLLPYMEKHPGSIYIDQASNFMSEANILNLLPKTEDLGIKCVLLDDGLDFYSERLSRFMLDNTKHLICYQVGGLSARALVEHLNLSVTADRLKGLEKYHFFVRSRAIKWGKVLKGIFPAG